MPRRTVPLTDMQIRTVKPQQREAKLFDGAGLFLLVTPGGGKLWRFKYRFNGKEKKLSLGAYPEISLVAARKKRDEAREQIAQGIDPGEAKKEEQAIRERETFEAVAREWMEKFAGQWEPTTAERILARLVRDVFPVLGHRPIAEITPPELLAMLRRVEERGVPYTAHRLRGTCGQVFQYAVQSGKVERNPASDLKGALVPVRTTHRAATTEPEDFAPLLRVIVEYQGYPVVRGALRLLPLLFARPGELRTMRWEDVDLKKGEWSYLVNKTKTPHIVPLAKQAIAILEGLYPFTGPRGYVFPSTRTRERPISNMTMNAALRRMGIDTRTEITGHGFRAVARTILDEVLGFRPDLIEHQLAHAVRDPLGRAYNRTAHLPERRKMMQSWADYLDRLAEGREEKIVPIRTAK